MILLQLSVLLIRDPKTSELYPSQQAAHSINVCVPNRSHDLQIAKMYGCVGAIHGQASGLQAFIHNEHGSLQQSISVSTFDDTAMWMKDPASKQDRDAAIRSDGYRWKDGTLRRRGTNMSLPVFNIRRAADQARDVATSSALGDAATKRGFQLALSDHLQRGHSDRRSEVASQSKDGSNPISKRARNLVNFDSRLKGVPLRGYDIFVRSNYHDGLEGDTTFGKRKSLDARWNALSYDEKQVYGRAAATENKENEIQKDRRTKTSSTSKLEHKVRLYRPGSKKRHGL